MHWGTNLYVTDITLVELTFPPSQPVIFLICNGTRAVFAWKYFFSSTKFSVSATRVAISATSTSPLALLQLFLFRYVPSFVLSEVPHRHTHSRHLKVKKGYTCTSVHYRVKKGHFCRYQLRVSQGYSHGHARLIEIHPKEHVQFLSVP